MTKIIYTGLVLFGLLSACKKGPDDPSFSLRSRKARLAGEWRLKSGNITLDELDAKSGEHFDAVYTINGTSLEGTHTTLTTIASVKGTFVLDLTIDKKGRFNFKETYSGGTIEAAGDWDFNSGVGEEKNKESFTLQIDDVTSGKTSGHYFNQFGLVFKYKIKELRNDVLVINCSELVYVDQKGITQKIQAEYSFVQ